MISNILALSVPDEGYFKNASYVLTLISTFILSIRISTNILGLVKSFLYPAR